jgi:hypothetical protein
MIEGVAISIAALLGETQRGPTAPRLVRSLRSFEEQFGGSMGGDKYLHAAVDGFFRNGGADAFICHIAAQDAGTARSLTLPVEAAGPGEWGNRIFVRWSATDAGSGFNLTIAFFGAGAPAGAGLRLQVDRATIALRAFDVIERVAGLQPEAFERRCRTEGKAAADRNAAEEMDGEPGPDRGLEVHPAFAGPAAGPQRPSKRPAV